MKICGRNPKIFSRVRQFHRRTDNKGSAMVVVIIAMAFIGILASVLMYMSLLNYQMKVNNLKAKDNFTLQRLCWMRSGRLWESGCPLLSEVPMNWF